MKSIKLLVVIISLFYFTANSNNEPKKENIIFIIVDDLRDLTMADNQPKFITPNIDKLKKNGVTFKNSFTNNPVCGASRASLLTGMRPTKSRYTTFYTKINEDSPNALTIASYLKKNGYKTISNGKISHYPKDAAYGWDEIFRAQRKNPKDYKDPINLSNLKNNFGPASEFVYTNDNDYSDGKVTQKTIKDIQSINNTDKPFFIAVGFQKPHLPFVAPKKYFDLYEKNEMKAPLNNDPFLKTISGPAAKSLRARKEQINLDVETVKTLREAYYATTSFVDAQIGKVLDKLKQTGLDKNTIIIFTSDHGYHLGEKGHWQKQTLYDRSTKVPLIISGPGIIPNKKVSHSPVELVDLYKTIMDLTGISVPEFVQGYSLKNVLTKTQAVSPRKSALSELLVSLEGKMAQGYSIKTDRYRFTKWIYDDKVYNELYDHKFDNKETYNLTFNSDYSTVKDSLNIVLNKRIYNAKLKPKGLGRQFRNAKPNFEPKRIYSSKKSKKNAK